MLTSLEAGNANKGIPDELVLEFAWKQKRILLTNNRVDFARLHRQGNSHMGIIGFTNDADFKSLAGRIDNALKDATTTDRFFVNVTKAGHSFRA